MSRKTRYNVKWVDEFSWLKKGKDDSYGNCTLCNEDFRIDGSGRSQVASHSKSKKHTDIEKLRKGLTSQSTFSRDSNDNVVLKRGSFVLTAKDKVTKAEILFALKSVSSNYSFASANGTSELFRNMFPDSLIAANYGMEETKEKYVIQFGIAPYVKEELRKDTRGTPYTFKFDESTTSQVKKQYDAYVQYWSKAKNIIVAGAYCGSLFVGHCTAEQLKDHFFHFVNDMNLEYGMLLHIGMDGPNVNKSFQNKLEKELCENYDTTVLDIGTCTLHPVHTAFKKGMLCLDIDLDQFVNDLHFFFKYSSARREDFVAIEEITEQTTEFILRHVSSRWLSMKRVLIRVMNQWENLKEYFMKSLPKEKNFRREIQDTERYKRIVANMKNPTTTIYMAFVVYIAEECETFLVQFQAKEPLIHLLYPKLTDLLFGVLEKFMKKSVLHNDDSCTRRKDGIELSVTDCSNLDNHKTEVDIGTRAKSLLINLPTHDKQKIKLTCKSFLKNMASDLQTKLPFNCKVLRDVQYLHPCKRNDPSSINAVSRLALAFGKVLNHNLQEVFDIQKSLTEEHVCDLVRQQWRIYQCDEIPETFYILRADEKDKFSRIDVYWRNVGMLRDLGGNFKYPQLYALIKCCLTLSHGNAVPEQGFSINKSILEKNRQTLGEDTIVALRLVKDAIIQSECVGTGSFPITRALIDSVNESHKRYEAYLDERRKEKKASEKARIAAAQKLEEERKNLKRKAETEKEVLDINNEIEGLKASLEVAENLAREGNKKMHHVLTKTHLSKKDATEAQAMVTMGIERQSALKIQIAELENKKLNAAKKLKPSASKN